MKDISLEEMVTGWREAAKQMDEHDARFESDLLKGDICRMFLTDDLEELIKVREYAHDRIEKIYKYHCTRFDKK